ncbi:MAG TPA: DUF1643 domain-containing protein [Chthoniobacterales bacterium]|jgi:hypothetical protein|nr:DUF1643 domain-containing protein [Chthoniobacterales bacterium]
MQNECVFSHDRRFRYILRHRWEPLFAPKFCTWIGLNPSVADETKLDPTLRRIRTFTAAWGYNGFIMTNLFALVSSDPDQLYSEADPVGPENDRYILQAIQETGVVIAAWGTVGGHRNRCAAVLKMISGGNMLCLKKTKQGYPIHPLYVAAGTEPTSYKTGPARKTHCPLQKSPH